jgi:hypothetical protein
MMSNYFTIPKGPELILLITAIVAYVYYRLILRHWLRAYWGGLRLTQRDIQVMRRLRMPLEELLAELVTAQQNGQETQPLLDMILESAAGGIALTIEDAKLKRRGS